MSTTPRIPKYQGRVEFYAHKEKILDLIDKGYSFVAIHDELVANHGVTMAYSTFHKHVKKYLASAASKPVASANFAGDDNTPKRKRPTTFTHNSHPTDEEIFGPKQT